MNSPFGTVFSMAAILATGGAALAVNATVLNPRTEAAPNSTDVSSPPPSAPATSAINEFQIPGVGLVTMSVVSGELRLDSVTTHTGFTYTLTESRPDFYEIRFGSAARIVTFTARLDGNRIVTAASGFDMQTGATQAIDPNPMSVSGGGGASGSSPSHASNDDQDESDSDHDRHESEHEDEHENGSDDDD